MTDQITWTPTDPAVVTHWRMGAEGEWVEARGADGSFTFPEVKGAVGYDLYVEMAVPPMLRADLIHDYSWIITPITKSKQLIHKGRKP